MKAKPLVRWAGGKSGCLEEILKVVPGSIQRYYEPFVGGGALFWELANQGRFESASISDVNQGLIALYKAVRWNLEELKLELRSHRYANTPEAFAAVRSQSLMGMGVVAEAARFLYLNKTCFNGLWRENRKGEFNTPYGKRKNVTLIDEETLDACRTSLIAARIQQANYADVVDSAEHGDFVYMDPPYLPKDDSADFTAYSAINFDMAEHARVAHAFRQLDDRGVAVALSNADTEATRILYAGFPVRIVPSRRSVAASGKKREVANDLLILGGPLKSLK